ncbi:hypothetical protein EVG20_g2362 [Dentipellis fragilis]|uniref:ATP-dependent DNA helicase n=1 Tax=Dentipellis fragilis TaxID=205917 RepID=A0A4Y9Z888_9AGAM|nr:hypothetical protein EVG20_g2362 [Dentipellis fragilis]
MAHVQSKITPSVRDLLLSQGSATKTPKAGARRPTTPPMMPRHSARGRRQPAMVNVEEEEDDDDDDEDEEEEEESPLAKKTKKSNVMQVLATYSTESATDTPVVISRDKGKKCTQSQKPTEAKKRARKDKDVDTMDDEPDENQHATTVPEGTSEPFMSKADFFRLMPGLLCQYQQEQANMTNPSASGAASDTMDLEKELQASRDAQIKLFTSAKGVLDEGSVNKPVFPVTPPSSQGTVSPNGDAPRAPVPQEIENDPIYKAYHQLQALHVAIPEDLNERYIKLVGKGQIKRSAPKLAPAGPSKQPVPHQPQVTMDTEHKTPLLEACPVTDASLKDPLLEHTYTEDLPRLHRYHLSVRETIVYGNFITLQNEELFGRLNIGRLTQMVNFCHNVAANLYNPSRCPVDLVSPSRWVGKPGTFNITPKAKDDLPFAGLVSFIFVENSQLKTISQFTNDDGEVKGNTSLTGVLITCEGQRALAFLAHHSHQQSEEVGVYNNAQGLMVWSTARSQLKVPAARPSKMRKAFIAQPSKSSDPDNASSVKIDYRTHWGYQIVPVWDSTVHFQEGSDGYTTVSFDVKDVLVNGPRRDPLWTEEIPTHSFCAVHYVASSYEKDHMPHLNLNLCGVQILAKYSDIEDDAMEIDTPEKEDVDMLDLTQATLVDNENKNDGYTTDSTLIADDENDGNYESEDTCSEVDSESEDDDDDDDYTTSQNKARTKGGPQFLTEHPHHGTHTVKIHPEAKAKVPSFISVLPRPDKGDHEDYCLTMLTLFKPWRSGLDLKLENETWDQSFRSYNFTEREKEIMKFMNIRHECYDARDDFRAQRIKAGNEKGLSFIGGQFWSEMDKQNMMEEAIDGAGISSLDNAFDESNISNANLKKAIEMAQIEAVVDAAGWLRPTSSPPTPMECEWTSGQDRNAAGWKNLLASKKAEVLAQKQSGNTSKENVKDPEEPSHEDPPNDVFPVYKSYLTKECKAEKKQDEKLIDSFVKQFTLNEEQERAFRIIANHSVSKIKDQLHMYIGGMGGTGKSQVIKALTAFFEARGKKFTFLIMAPTGTAAALIGGSTYHSILGFRGTNGDEKGSSGVTLRIDDAAFAGKNMIYAGDFGQLPPISRVL